MKTMRVFLGLAGYYCKFVKYFTLIADPLTAMLQKGSFKWTDEAVAAFEALKIALTSAPVLQLPNFEL